MTKHDEVLVGAAQTIIEAYNDSLSSCLIPKDKLMSPPYYEIRHGDKGYYLFTSMTDNLDNPYILTIQESICDFIEQVFFEITNKSTVVKWADISSSKDVYDAVQWYFDIPGTKCSKMELSNEGKDQYLDRYGKPIQTVWVEVDHSRTIEAFKALEDMGFTYFDRNFWYITL